MSPAAPTAPAPLFTDRQKLRALEREVAFRKGVFAKRVEKGTMSAEDAEFETRIMQAIAEDYRQKIANDDGLFRA
jgi:hypothetical protein